MCAVSSSAQRSVLYSRHAGHSTLVDRHTTGSVMNTGMSATTCDTAGYIAHNRLKLAREGLCIILPLSVELCSRYYSVVSVSCQCLGPLPVIDHSTDTACEFSTKTRSTRLNIF